MALTKGFTDPSTGIEAPNAYFRVRGFVGDKNQTVAQINIYFNQSCRVNEKLEMAQWDFTIPQAVANLTDIYSFLKTLPEFAGAQDA